MDSMERRGSLEAMSKNGEKELVFKRISDPKETEANGSRPGVDCVLLQMRVLFLLSRPNATEVWFFSEACQV